MNREQFFGRLAALDEERLRKTLWSLYWRGTEVVRERIEAEIDPDQASSKKAASVQSVDPELVLDDVRNSVALARSGSYMGGDRRVSPRERSRWRFTFQRLAADAQACLMTEDPRTASAAMEELIDFVCELHDYDYFHTEDAVEAARFVVSDAAVMLWRRIYEHDGFPAFASVAASQLIRWESAHGWTRGFGRVAEAETSLASAIAGMLRNHDAWVAFADRYLEALDKAAGGDEPDREHSFRRPKHVREDRAANLSAWHMLMFDKLFDPETEDRLDRLLTHPALGGPELAIFQARLAQRRGNLGLARKLVSASLEKLPGHHAFLNFAIEIDAPLPARARQIHNERVRAEKLAGKTHRDGS
ncbi:MAG TPA: hypothetical protein VNA69_24300 [Thermoanaerobaculia bacterium]|nr:hypothetical protein [Thermoanaerobaculia bacterium]